MSIISNGTSLLPCVPHLLLVLLFVLCAYSGWLNVGGLVVTTLVGPPLLPPTTVGCGKKVLILLASSVTWAKWWIVQQSNSCVCWSFGG